MARSTLVRVGSLPRVGGGSVTLTEALGLSDAVTPTLSTPAGSGWPTASTTGTSGTLTSGTVDFGANGAIYTNMNITNSDNYITGDNMTFINCRFPDNGPAFANSNGTTVTDCEFGTRGMAVSSSSNITFTRIKIVNYTADGIHVTSDGGSMCTNVTIRDSYIFNANPQNGAHADGIQVRGSSGLRFENNYMDQGPTFSVYKNAAVFFEEANGGNGGFIIRGNYFKGGGYTTAYLNTGWGTVEDNTFDFPNSWPSSGSIFFGGGMSGGITASGNVDGDGNPI